MCHKGENWLVLTSTETKYKSTLEGSANKSKSILKMFVFVSSFIIMVVKIKKSQLYISLTLRGELPNVVSVPTQKKFICAERWYKCSLLSYLLLVLFLVLPRKAYEEGVDIDACIWYGSSAEHNKWENWTGRKKQCEKFKMKPSYCVLYMRVYNASI